MPVERPPASLASLTAQARSAASALSSPAASSTATPRERAVDPLEEPGQHLARARPRGTCGSPRGAMRPTQSVQRTGAVDLADQEGPHVVRPRGEPRVHVADDRAAAGPPRGTPPSTAASRSAAGAMSAAVEGRAHREQDAPLPAPRAAPAPPRARPRAGGPRRRSAPAS